MATVSVCRSRLNAQFLVVALCLLVSSLPYAVFGQAPVELSPTPTTLEIRKPVQRSIAGGQKHLYRIDLSDSDFVMITLDQSGVDLIIRFLDQDGKLVAEFDSESRLRGTEKAEGVALGNGAFRIEVEPRYKDAPTGQYGIEWLVKRPATENDKELQQARILLREQRALEREGKYKESLALAERVLEIRERILGPDDVEVGITLIRIGNQYDSLGDNAKAEAFARRALAIYEARLGPDHLRVGEATNNLAVLARVRGEVGEAEKMFLRVVAIKERAFGPDHPSIATTLNNLGILYRRRGDFIRAESAYARALAIRERALGPDHSDVASVLQTYAALRFYMGDYEGAVVLDERSVAIREKNMGPDHPLVAQSLNGLASTYLELGKLDQAEQLALRAIAIYQKRLGANSINVARAQEVLSRIYLARDDIANAKSALARALEVTKKSSGKDLDDMASLLLQMGAILTLQHDYQNAESHLKQSLELREKISGRDGYYAGRALAEMYMLKGDIDETLKHQQCAARVYEKSIDINLAVGSDHQKLSYMKLISDDLNQTLALSAGPAQNNATARMLGASALIQRKGRVLDATAASLAALRQRLNPQDQRLFDDLGDVNRDLAENTLNPPSALSLAAYTKLIADLKSKKEGMEKEIAGRSRGFYGQTQPVTLERIQALIPADAALLEFAIYRPLVKTAATMSSKLGEPRYVAYVIRNSGLAGSADLGPATEIDGALRQFRAALRDPKRTDAGKLGRDADQKIMAPIRQFLTESSHLLVSPDGDLNLIPFEALVDEKGKNLVENYSISYLTTGRDLVRMLVERASKSQSAVVANPVFGEQSSDELVAAVSPVRIPKASRRRSITNTRNLSDTYFAPLSGTSAEANSIKTLFPDVKLLTGASATETAVKALTAPKILHIATHGFFLENPNLGDNKNGGKSGPSIANLTLENPLLRSGLAFAGANRHGSGKGEKDDGILTALEASGLNLWGTKLVVLSACDTGLGEVRNGEGVYGLRRSFVLAGAETVVMSMWPVSDYVTRELMTNYYKNLKKGMGRGEALRQVQLEMIKRPNRRHPFYWASFIQSGEWATLDGKR